MKKLTLIILTMFLLSTIDYGLSTTYAAIPKLINYQGRLTDSQGQTITGTKSVTFRIYETESGGSPLWQEIHTATFDRGIFNLFIGGVTPLNLPFDKQYYLGIQVGSDPEMSPRQRLVSSAYAFTSENANKVANVEVSTTPAPNKLLPLDANAKLPASIIYSRSQLFTTSGTWTCPAGVTTVYITMCGGGGGGGGGLAAWGNNASGGGGASGAALINTPIVVTGGNTYTVTIGSGGSGSSADGSAGGSTSFDSISVAGGGGGGGARNYNPNLANGGGGTPYGGPDSSGAGNGAYGTIKGGYGAGGNGGTGGAGAGGVLYGLGGNGGSSAAGGNASGYGAGGGGGGSGGTTAYGGGNGASGICTVMY